MKSFLALIVLVIFSCKKEDTLFFNDSSKAEDKQMDTRTIFLNVCNEIANQLEGFKAFEKGQKFKKSSADSPSYQHLFKKIKEMAS